MKLTSTQMQLIADCLAIGFEGASDNSTDCGGENTPEDLAEVAAFMEILTRHAAFSHDTQVSLSTGLTTHGELAPSVILGYTHDEIDWLTPVPSDQ